MIPNALINGPRINKGRLPILSVRIPIGKLNNSLAKAKIDTAIPIELIATSNFLANIGKSGDITPCPVEIKAVAMQRIISLLLINLLIVFS
tara:strand:+ start:6737 stop:7009 length:273 start_codon:yes stop_codon:yes gene_type:complete